VDFDVRPMEVPAREVREQLERILSSVSMRKGARLSRLLRYLVEAVLDGSGDTLKESMLGVEVFERPSFDPRLDTVVRSTARNLRFKLDEYYITEGRNDSVVIELPKGSYVPTFHRREAALPASPVPPSNRRKRRPLFIAAGAIAAIVLAAFGARLILRPRPPRPAGSLAVEPFENRTGDAGLEYVAEGLTEELTGAFAGMPGLRVIAPASAAAAHSQDARAICRELHVSAILTGSIERSGHGIRVRAVVETADRVLWRQTFEAKARDIGVVEPPLVRAAALSLGLSPDRTRMRSGTPNPKAHDLYIQGRYLWSRRDEADMRESVHLFERALDEDPSYALAEVGLADAWDMMADDGMAPAREALPRAEQAAVRALVLAPDSARAHASLGLVESSEWDWTEAERELRRALKLDPDYGEAWGWLADIATVRGRFDEAAALLRQAQNVDPLNWMLTYALGENAYYAGRYDEAIAEANRIRTVSPFQACNLLARAWSRKGMLGEARDAVRCEFQGRDGLQANLMRVAFTQPRAEAVRDFRALMRRPGHGAGPFYIACIAAGIGETGPALDWLDKAWAVHDPDLASIRVEPSLDSLHGQPRYRDLVRRIGLQ
jgi:adenylate cyclase